MRSFIVVYSWRQAAGGLDTADMAGFVASSLCAVTKRQSERVGRTQVQFQGEMCHPNPLR